MKVKIKFFGPLRKLFGSEEKEIELGSEANIEELLDLLCDSRQRRQKIFDNSGKLISYLKICKNGEYIQSLDGIHAELKEGDVVIVLTPVFGG